MEFLIDYGKIKLKLGTRRLSKKNTVTLKKFLKIWKKNFFKLLIFF